MVTMLGMILSQVSSKIIIVLMDHGNHERQQRENINILQVVLLAVIHQA